MESRSVSEDEKKAILDEQTLAKLLEAAYVLQEHNREMRALEHSLELTRERMDAEVRGAVHTDASKPTLPTTAPTPKPIADYSLTLARIVETQHDIQVRRLGVESAMALVAERASEITRASGAAVGMLDGKNVHYRAVAGLNAPPKGTTLPLEKTLSGPCLKTSQVLRSEDISSDPSIDAEECRRRGIQSIIAVPIFHQEETSGALELYYATPSAFTDQDIHTCQLMAGLITESLVHEDEHSLKKSLATERAAVLEALEKLPPNLAALVDQPAVSENKVSTPAPVSNPVSSRQYSCPKCGHRLVGEEQFCGQCGSPRSGDYEPPTMQSKVATLWLMQETARKKGGREEASKTRQKANETPDNSSDVSAENPPDDSVAAQFPDFFRASLKATNKSSEPASAPTELLDGELAAGLEDYPEDSPEGGADAGTSEELTSEEPERRQNWNSAASAREFLEQLASANRKTSLIKLWNTRRGDIYLAVAVILVVCVLMWGLRSGRPASATGAQNAAASHHKSPEADLPLFDRMLIGLGLAEPPDAQEDKGNPSAQVWVDTHSALYYCPGADLYGKTPAGKFTTQRAAQLDQFQPAARKACN